MTIKTLTPMTLTVNGALRQGQVESRTLLVDFIRDDLQLTGTHVGCDTSQCGCCTVHLDHQAVKSCTILALQVDGRAITTIEGLAPGLDTTLDFTTGNTTPTMAALHPVQQAFSACHGLQCGFCTPGMIMATVDLLSRHPNPNDEQIIEGLSGNLCRCTGYVNIISAVRQAAQLINDSASATQAMTTSQDLSKGQVR
jgi:aerobic carbon-monoxide dehydrogenase small subunit